MELTRNTLKGPGLRGVISSRRGAVLFALLCAILAAGIIVVALGQYRKGLTTANKQDTVLVASATIQKGTSGDAVATSQLVRATPVLAAHISAGALTDASALRGLVAARDILPGQQITAADFAAGSGVSAQLGPNQRALSIALDPSHGLTGVVGVGDRVDVYGSFTVQPNGITHPVQVVKLLIPAALVLRAPSTGGSGGLGGGGGAGANIVVEVNQNDAPNLAYASDNGKVWLVLRPGNAAAPNQDLTTIDALLLGVHIHAGSSGGSPTLSFKSTFSLSGGGH